MGTKVEKAVAKREKFLEAALRVVAKEGFPALTSHSVARELGVSQPSFYYYFPTQSDFYQQLMELIVRTNRALVLERMGASTSAWTKIRAYVEGNLRWAECYPAQTDVLCAGFLACAPDPAVRRTVSEALQGGEQRIYGFIAEGFTEQELDPIVPAKTAAFLLHKALLGGVVDINGAADRHERRERTERDMSELARHLLRPKETKVKR